MLPPTHVRRVEAFPIAPTRAVVVVLPAEPVIPITLAGHRFKNSCESLVMGMFRSRAACTNGASAGTPPLIASKSTPSNKLNGCEPNTKLISRSAKPLISACNIAAGRKSEIVTVAPSCTAKRARAVPCRANPRMRRCFPFILFVH